MNTYFFHFACSKGFEDSKDQGFSDSGIGSRMFNESFKNFLPFFWCFQWNPRSLGSLNPLNGKGQTVVSLEKGQRGFTLIELMIAMVILGIAFMGLATMQLACIRGNSDSNRLTKAIILAQDKMEELKGLGPHHPDLADTNPTNNSNLRHSIDPHQSDHTQSFSDTPDDSFTRVWNVADDIPLSGRKMVVVIVTWGSPHKSVAVSSVL